MFCLRNTIACNADTRHSCKQYTLNPPTEVVIRVLTSISYHPKITTSKYIKWCVRLSARNKFEMLAKGLAFLGPQGPEMLVVHNTG